MKPVWRIVLGILILIIGGTALLWLPLFLRWVKPNAEVLQGLDALISIVSAVIGLIVIVFGFRKHQQARSSRKIHTGGGNYVEENVRTSGGNYAGRDSYYVDGDLTLADPLSKEHNDHLLTNLDKDNPRWTERNHKAIDVFLTVYNNDLVEQRDEEKIIEQFIRWSVLRKIGNNSTFAVL
jgi:hypothetical protein